MSGLYCPICDDLFSGHSAAELANCRQASRDAAVVQAGQPPWPAAIRDIIIALCWLAAFGFFMWATVNGGNGH